MPTKVNGAGEQQEYDPSSGRYGNGNNERSFSSGRFARYDRKRIKEQVRTRYSGKISDYKLDEYNREALKWIIDESGLSNEKAIEFQNTIIDYIGGDYEKYSQGGKEKEKSIIDNGLKLLPTYDNIIYRGIKLNYGNATMRAWQNNLMNAEEGDILSWNALSSWSSKEDTAHDFSGMTGKHDSMILLCENNKSAVGVQNISKFNTKEAEVLSPSTTKYLIKKKTIKSKYDWFKEKAKEYEDAGDDSNSNWYDGTAEANKKMLEKYKMYVYVVEEV